MHLEGLVGRRSEGAFERDLHELLHHRCRTVDGLLADRRGARLREPLAHALHALALEALPVEEPEAGEREPLEDERGGGHLRRLLRHAAVRYHRAAVGHLARQRRHAAPADCVEPEARSRHGLGAEGTRHAGRVARLVLREHDVRAEFDEQSSDDVDVGARANYVQRLDAPVSAQLDHRLAARAVRAVLHHRVAGLEAHEVAQHAKRSGADDEQRGCREQRQLVVHSEELVFAADSERSPHAVR